MVMSGDYTYVVTTPEPFGDVTCATRHEAVGKAVIIGGYHGDHFDPEVRVRGRYVTDPV